MRVTTSLSSAHEVCILNCSPPWLGTSIYFSLVEILEDMENPWFGCGHELTLSAASCSNRVGDILGCALGYFLGEFVCCEMTSQWAMMVLHWLLGVNYVPFPDDMARHET